MRGRPSLYTPELAAEICRRMAEGELVIEIAETPGMPSAGVIYQWAHADQNGFADAYARARLHQAEALAERAVRSALRVPDAAAARVQMDGQKWLAARLDPRKWSDRNTTVLEGNPDAPLVVEDTRRPIGDLIGAAVKPPG